jgi:HK97 family phage major capsid protein
MRFKYPFLLATLAMLALVFSLFTIQAISGPEALAMVLLFQLAIVSLDKPRAAVFMAALSQAQVDEMDAILRSLEGYGDMMRDLNQIAKEEGGLKKFRERVKRLELENDEMRGQLRRATKLGAAAASGTGVRWIGNKPFVTDDCAEALTATFIVGASKIENGMERLFPDGAKAKYMLDHSRAILGAEVKTALDGTTTPLPTVYVPQVVELVWKYGQARQFATVFPLGAGTVKLPRLKAGEDDFVYLGAGTAGMSQAVGEKRVSAELVTFTANKAGGMIRIPQEIEEDTFIPIGQFLARYIARQLAKLEDKTMFLADGSGTYAGCTGVGPYCAANPTYLLQLAAGKTKPTDATLNDFRSIRGLVNPAVLVDDPAYYMNPTLEVLLSGFNTIGSPLIYRPAAGNQPATLDGYPIRWVGIMQPYKTTAAASTYLATFGSLPYWYLGERGAPRIEVSREVFFATDEIAMRALERIDVEAMAIDAMSALQTAAA